MELIADIFLIAGALGAGLYCVVLSRRLSRFTDLEKGVGGAIAALSTQVDDMTQALATSRQATAASAESLKNMTDKAEGVAQRLELMVASLHDLPMEGPQATDDEEEADRSLFHSHRANQERKAQ